LDPQAPVRHACAIKHSAPSLHASVPQCDEPLGGEATRASAQASAKHVVRDNKPQDYLLFITYSIISSAPPSRPRPYINSRISIEVLRASMKDRQSDVYAAASRAFYRRLTYCTGAKPLQRHTRDYPTFAGPRSNPCICTAQQMRPDSQEQQQKSADRVASRLHSEHRTS
jgi:hypothetical protein